MGCGDEAVPCGREGEVQGERGVGFRGGGCRGRGERVERGWGEWRVESAGLRNEQQ